MLESERTLRNNMEVGVAPGTQEVPVELWVRNGRGRARARCERFNGETRRETEKERLGKGIRLVTKARAT